MSADFKTITDRDNNSINRKIILYSPLIIIVINITTAIIAGKIVGKWAFIPIILIEWVLFAYFIFLQKDPKEIKKWLKKSIRKYSWIWIGLTIFIGLLPLPIFIKYYYLLYDITVFLPWIILALVNPFLEEFYWRGVLLDQTKNWMPIISVLYSSLLFSANHAVFGINSELFRGSEVLISTLIMGIIWAITYKRTNSLRWVIISHFLVDFLNLSSAAFLDLYKAGH